MPHISNNCCLQLVKCSNVFQLLKHVCACISLCWWALSPFFFSQFQFSFRLDFKTSWNVDYFDLGRRQFFIVIQNHIFPFFPFFFCGFFHNPTEFISFRFRQVFICLTAVCCAYKPDLKSLYMAMYNAQCTLMIIIIVMISSFGCSLSTRSLCESLVNGFKHIYYIHLVWLSFELHIARSDVCRCWR